MRGRARVAVVFFAFGCSRDPLPTDGGASADLALARGRNDAARVRDASVASSVDAADDEPVAPPPPMLPEIPPAKSDGPWHWENPRPQGDVLRVVTSTSATSVWAFGDATYLRGDGTSFHLSSLPGSPGQTVRDAWVNRDDDAWVIAMQVIGPLAGAVYHWDGAAWHDVTPEGIGAQPLRLWSSGPADVWLFDSDGRLAHWDGARWSITATGRQLSSLWGFGPADVWTWDVAAQTALHFDGTAWSTASAPGPVLGGSGPSDEWFATNTDLAHGATGAWSDVSLPLSNGVDWPWIASRAVDDAWLMMYDGNSTHWDGSQWSPIAQIAGPLEYGGYNRPRVGADAVWMGGISGEIARCDASGCQPRSAGGGESIAALWGSAVDDVWAVGLQGLILHRTASDAIWRPVASTTKRDLLTVTGSARDDAWAFGQGGRALHWDGAAWSRVPLFTDGTIRASVAIARDDVWVVAGDWGNSSSLFHYDGRGWTATPTGVEYVNWAALGGSASDDVWLVGTYQQPHAICPDNDCFTPVARHWDGGAWSEVALPTVPSNAYGDGARGVWVGGRGDVWVAGAPGLTHSDGNGWSPWFGPPAHAVVHDGSSLWVTSDGASVFRFDGSGFTGSPLPMADPRLGAFAAAWSSDGSMWIAALGGSPAPAILRHDPETFAAPVDAAIGARFDGGATWPLDGGAADLASAGCPVEVRVAKASGCARMSDGSVWCWGAPLFQPDTTVAPVWPPARAISSGATALMVEGDGEVCALLGDGSVWCWGGHSGGGSTGGTTEGAPLPSLLSLPPMARLVPGGALDALGRAWTWRMPSHSWGFGAEDQLRLEHLEYALGLGDRDFAGGCAVASDGSLACIGWALLVDRVVPGDFRSYRPGEHSGCTLDGAGVVSCWGDNALGELGDGTTVPHGDPAPTLLAAGALDLDGYADRYCAALGDGTVWCWGAQLDGSAGPTPTRIAASDGSAFSGASQISVGASDACALRSDGVWCWGDNASLQLGASAPSVSATPVRVIACPP